MKISYAITTHNEVEEVKQLIPFVYEHKKEEDEIIVLDDFSVEEMEEVLKVVGLLELVNVVVKVVLVLLSGRSAMGKGSPASGSTRSS